MVELFAFIFFSGKEHPRHDFFDFNLSLVIVILRLWLKLAEVTEENLWLKSAPEVGQTLIHLIFSSNLRESGF